MSFTIYPEGSALFTSGVKAFLSVVWLDSSTCVKPSSFLTTMSRKRQSESLCRTLYLSRLSNTYPLSSPSFRLAELCRWILPLAKGEPGIQGSVEEGVEQVHTHTQWTTFLFIQTWLMKQQWKPCPQQTHCLCCESKPVLLYFRK